MMIERLVHQAITEGIALLVDDPTILEEFLREEALLGDAEIERVRDTFLEKVPTVFHGYARADAEFPCYAVIVSGDDQTLGFIGDEGDYHDDPDDPDFGMDVWSSIFEYTVTVVLYTRHPDQTLYYYHLLKHFVIGAEALFKANDFFDQKLSGADMAPDQETMPAGLFARRLTISCSRQYNQKNIASRLNRAWKVRGLHIKREGAPGRIIGDVDDNVVTYTSGE